MSDNAPDFSDMSLGPPRPTRPAPPSKPEPESAPAPAREPTKKVKASAKKPKRDADKEPGIHTPAILPREMRRRLDCVVAMRNLDRAKSGKGDLATRSSLICEMIEAQLPKLEKKQGEG